MHFAWWKTAPKQYHNFRLKSVQASVTRIFSSRHFSGAPLVDSAGVVVVGEGVVIEEEVDVVEVKASVEVEVDVSSLKSKSSISFGSRTKLHSAAAK